jgi:hypothetical protein
MIKLLPALILLLLCLFLYNSCSSSKVKQPSEFADAQITFGSGGGFTGLVTDYTLLGNGQLFKRSSKDNQFVELKKGKKNAAQQALENYTFLGIDQLTVNDPGNLYYFIEHKTKEGKTHRLTWGNGASPQEEKLKLYYSLLNAMIPKE